MPRGPQSLSLAYCEAWYSMPHHHHPYYEHSKTRINHVVTHLTRVHQHAHKAYIAGLSIKSKIIILPGGLSVSIVIPVGSTWGGKASYRSGSSSSTADNITEGIPQEPNTLLCTALHNTVTRTAARNSHQRATLSHSQSITVQ